MTRYSLTEIETHCRKAARGAGYHWGEAEELSKAARWLCAKGQDGAAEVLAMLQEVDGVCDTYRPDTFDNMPDPICGLTLGCALADRGANSLDGLELRSTIIQPMIAIGVLGNTCGQTTLEITTNNGVAVLSNEALVLDGSWDNATVISISVLASAPNKTTQEFTDVTSDTWNGLNDFAHRTYVPSTEESRRKGAG